MAAPRLRQEDLRKVKILYEDDDLIVVDKRILPADPVFSCTVMADAVSACVVELWMTSRSVV